MQLYWMKRRVSVATTAAAIVFVCKRSFYPEQNEKTWAKMEKTEKHWRGGLGKLNTNLWTNWQLCLSGRHSYVPAFHYSLDSFRILAIFRDSLQGEYSYDRVRSISWVATDQYVLFHMSIKDIKKTNQRRKRERERERSFQVTYVIRHSSTSTLINQHWCNLGHPPNYVAFPVMNQTRPGSRLNQLCHDRSLSFPTVTQRQHPSWQYESKRFFSDICIFSQIEICEGLKSRIRLQSVAMSYRYCSKKLLVKNK